ncbi:MAG TPA: hypothetical protein VGB89_09740 [Bacteroidota bacterium]
MPDNRRSLSHPRKLRMVVPAAVSFLLLSWLHLPAVAQVIIRDTIRINQQSQIASTNSILQSSTGEAIWVAPRAGVVLIRVNNLFQILTPISSSAQFHTITPDTAYSGNVVEWASETVYYGPEDFFDWCAHVPVTGTDHDIRGISPYDRSLFITIDAEGDTLSFSYSAVGSYY